MLKNILQVGHFPALMQREIATRASVWTERDIIVKPELKQKVQGIITRSNVPISQDLIRSLPDLRIIATCGVGYDLIPVSFARERGVMVTNTPDVLNTAVAELCLGMTISLMRQIPASDCFVRSSLWLRNAYPLTTGLAGKKIGIAGMGRVGREIARRFEAFETTIAYYDRQQQCELDWPFFASLAELASFSDVLVAAVPGGLETRHIVDAEILKSLGSEGYFINIARGSVVDENALLTALEKGDLAGAALDVYPNEPFVNQRFVKLNNVLLSPHAGSATKEARLAMIELAMANLEAFFADATSLNLVNG